jgi:sulfite exporter TauE/SafE
MREMFFGREFSYAVIGKIGATFGERTVFDQGATR